MIVITFGLGDDDLGLRKARLHGGGDARNQSAAGRRRHHDVGHEPERRHVLGDLAAGGALPRDHKGIVIGANQRSAALAGDLVGDGFAVLAVAVVEHDFRAIGLGALALGERRVRRHHDGRLHVQDLCRGRHALRVIAGGERHHAAAALVLRDRRQLVEGAAELERAGPLQHFRLQEDSCPRAFVENGERQQRRAHRKGRDHPRGGLDISRADGWFIGDFGHPQFVSRLRMGGQGALA